MKKGTFRNSALKMEPFKFPYGNLKVAQKREPTMRFPFLLTCSGLQHACAWCDPGFFYGF